MRREADGPGRVTRGRVSGWVLESMRLRSRIGFTLIELVIVAVILAGLAAASVPRLTRTAERIRSEQAVFDLVQQLRYARDRAVSLGQAVDWVWDATERRARLEVLTPEGYTPLSERRWRGRRLPDPLTLDLTGQDEGRISFFPDGTSEPASFQIASPKRTYTITTDATTGQSDLSGTPAR